MYTDTITLFNVYSSRNGDLFFPTVIHNVNLNIDKAAIVAKYGESAQDRAALNVRYSKADGVISVAGKPYKQPKEWADQVNDDLGKTITFKDGQTADFFLVGEWDDTTPIMDDDYLDGFKNYLMKKYDNVFTISSVGFYTVIPHFQILAK